MDRKAAPPVSRYGKEDSRCIPVELYNLDVRVTAEILGSRITLPRRPFKANCRRALWKHVFCILESRRRDCDRAPQELWKSLGNHVRSQEQQDCKLAERRHT